MAEKTRMTDEHAYEAPWNVLNDAIATRLGFERSDLAKRQETRKYCIAVVS